MMKTVLLSLLLLITAEARKSGVAVFAEKREDIPYIHLAHAGYEQLDYFDNYIGRIPKLARCVRRETPPETGGHCSGSGKTCLFGDQECPDGSGQPSTRCDCRDGKWLCFSFECPDMEDFSCPVMQPQEGLIGRQDQRCEYGEAECCGRTFPTTYCTGLAGSPFTCTNHNPCDDATTTCAEKAKALRDHTTHPKAKRPVRAAVKLDETTITTKALGINSASCPAKQPEYGFEESCSADEDYSCHYGYSCCCPDKTQCSSDLKCECKDGKFKCEAKTCDQFLCEAKPKAPKSPFKEDVFKLNPYCPSYQYATTLPAGTKGECAVPTDGSKEFFHCMYGFSCCCQDALSCSSDLACTCQHGEFSCIPRDCPTCDAEDVAEPVICPRSVPESGMGCPTNEGETCGYGEYECCDGAQYHEEYCTCNGGVWECNDSAYLCGYTECTDK